MPMQVFWSVLMTIWRWMKQMGVEMKLLMVWMKWFVDALVNDLWRREMTGVVCEWWRWARDGTWFWERGVDFCRSLSEFRNDGVKGAGEGDKKHRSMHTPYNIILLANRTAWPLVQFTLMTLKIAQILDTARRNIYNMTWQSSIFASFHWTICKSWPSVFD